MTNKYGENLPLDRMIEIMEKYDRAIKIGDRVELIDGFTVRYGTVYGIETTECGTQYRIKIERDEQVEFEWVSRIHPKRQGSHHPIGVYKI